MFENEPYITITGLNHYFNMRPFQIGSLVMLRKEPGNAYDAEAIEVLAPLLGRVGYVANSPQTVAAGCLSAGRLYDDIPDECAAVVRFMTSTKVIARVLPDKKLHIKVELVLEDVKGDICMPVRNEDLAESAEPDELAQ